MGGEGALLSIKEGIVTLVFLIEQPEGKINKELYGKFYYENTIFPLFKR